jgi:DNA-binding IclR family transcriptional regulator
MQVRFARVHHLPLRGGGLNAFCAPVFDSAGNLVLGITAMGPEATFDNEWNGKVAAPLRACALEVSRRLGYLEAA